MEELHYDLVAIYPGSRTGAPEQQLDLEILVGFVRAAGFTVQLLDPAIHQLAVHKLLNHAATCNPLAVYWHLPSRAAFMVLRRLAGDTGLRRGTALAIAGGYFATRHDCAILESVPDLDAIVYGETDITVVELLRGLKEGRPWASEPGLCHRASSQPRRNSPRELLEDLGQLPPAVSDLFHESRLQKGQGILFNRGCDSNCQYCGLQVSYRQSFKRTRFWRSREPRSILDEIEEYAGCHGVRFFLFNAYVLFGYSEAGGKLFEEVLQGLVNRRLGIEFSFVTHPDKLTANRHLLPLMKEAGLRSIYLGIDSGLERALALYQVDFGLPEIFSCLESLHAERIRFDVGFFFFDPYISFHEIWQHLSFLRGIHPYFRHMERPFSYFLENQLVTSMLRLNWGMPLCRRLQEDGLLIPSDPLERDPAVRFRDPLAGKFCALHQFLWRTEEVKALRSILWDRERASAYSLELFPLRMAETLWTLLEKESTIDLDSAMGRMASWLQTETAWVPTHESHKADCNEVTRI